MDGEKGQNGPIIGPEEPSISAHQTETRKLIRAMMTLTGLTASGLAKAAGLTPSTVNRFMHKSVAHSLSQRTMLALMTEAFSRLKDEKQANINRDALELLVPLLAMYQQGMLEIAPELKKTFDMLNSLTWPPPIISSPFVASDKSSEQNQMPVVLTITTSINVTEGNFVSAPMHTVKPAYLHEDPHAFALLMPDDSMMPRFDSSDMLYVSPSRTLEGLKADVVLEPKTGGFNIGQLLALTSESVILGKLFPNSNEVYDRMSLRGIYRIVGVQRM